jgi:uncharacterized protein (DUF1499 family)
MADSPTNRISAHARPGARSGWLASLGLAAAVLSALALVLAGLGYKTGWWPLPIAFTVLRWGAYGGAAGAALSLLGMLVARSNRRALVAGLAGLVIGGAAAGIPWRWQQTARAVPRIHDITTDLEHPPAFVAILPLRAYAPNSAVHEGEKIAAQQRSGYPDIVPATLNVPPAQAFDRAEAAARAMGWEVVAADRASGRIEATDTTRFFGFKDDVVIRVQAAPGGSRVDVRSVSRVGGSDVGTNATRIRAYLARLRQD